MQQFKATIQASKPKFLQKVISFTKNVVDAYNPKLTTKCTVFIPKLTYKYTTPVVMCNISNGRSSTLFRCQHPDHLSDFFRQIADQIDTDIFRHQFDLVEELSTRIVLGEQVPLTNDKLFNFSSGN